MSTHITTVSVEAASRFEAEKAAAQAAKKAGHTIIMVGSPTADKNNKWNVPVTVEGEEKKTLKTILTPKKETAKVVSIENK